MTWQNILHIDNILHHLKLSSTVLVSLSMALQKHAHALYSIFHISKKDNFQMKNCDIFLIMAQNIDCGYTLEPPP